MRHYEKVEGWFNMEKQYRKLLDKVPPMGTFVEIGCWKGKSTAYLLEEVAKDAVPKNIYVVDNFKGSDNTELEKEVYKNIDSGELHGEFLTNILPFRPYLHGIYINESHLAAINFENNSVDVVFIDAGHSYENVKQDIIAWLPKVKNKGILAGHDYNDSWPGVIKAVNELLGKENITVENNCWFHKIK